MKYLLLLLLLSANIAPANANVNWMRRQRDWIFNKLVNDGISITQANKIMFDTRLTFYPNVSKINMKHEEDPAAYKTFISEQNIQIAQSFEMRQRTFLDKTEAATGVPGEIITAILLIESKCGEYTPKVDVISALFSVAVSSSTWLVNQNYAELKRTYPELKRAEIAKRAVRRSNWAYRELAAFIKYVNADSADDPYSVLGSWAGAFGLPQFIPSSYKSFAVDGDGDNYIDLFNDKDAIASIANYLLKNGWRRGLTRKQGKKVIWTYNHSKLYVDTVFNVADKIK